MSRYTVLRANRTVNPAVIEAVTKEAGAVALSEADTPDEWAALMASGLDIAPYAPQLRSYMLPIASIYDRATDAEAAVIEAGIEARGARIRGLWRTSPAIASDGELFAELRVAMAGAFGEARASELLAEAAR